MSADESTPTSANGPASPASSMEVLTPRINALRSSVSKNFESSVNRKSVRKTTIEGADRDHRRALVEGLVTARRAEKPARRGSYTEGSMVALADFESFKRTIEARVQALEEALEQKDDEVDALQSQLAALTGGAASSKASPKNATVSPKGLSGVPTLNLGGSPASTTPVSPGGKKLPKPPSMILPVSLGNKGGSSGMAATWAPDDVCLFLGQLGVFKLWTASMVCKAWRSTACGVVLTQKQEQLRAGAEPALEYHAANPENTDELAKLLPPLFLSGGPYHTLGLSGFVRIQELLQREDLQLKDLYKFMRDITRRK